MTAVLPSFLGVMPAIVGGIQGPTLTTPTLGTVTPFTQTQASDATTYAFSHTRAVGAGLQVHIQIKHSGSPGPGIASIAYNGVAMTLRGQQTVAGSTVACAVATMEPGEGDTGSNVVLVTLDDNAGRHAVGYAIDIEGSLGVYQGFGVAALSASATTYSQAITPDDAGNLLVATGGVLDTQSTLSVGAGYTLERTDASDAASTNHTEAILEYATAGSLTAIDFNVADPRDYFMLTGIEWKRG